MAVRFGDFELSFERLELRRGRAVVDIEPQVFDVLAYLVRHRDRLVPKTELLDAVWGDRFVSESALTSRIKSARRAIGDTGRDQRVIKTVHGRGYRFVIDVVEVAANDDPGAGTGAGDRPSPNTPAEIDGDEPAARRALRLLDELDAGRGVALRIEGGARSARTEVLHRLADAARRRSFAVGMSAPSIAGDSPLGCVAEALDEMTQRRPDLMDELPAGCRAELEQVFATHRPTTRQRWLVAARELLVIAAERAGAVLLIDHVDQAPPETVALVDDMARLTRGHRAAVVVAGRTHGRPGDQSTASRWFEVVALPDDRPASDPVPMLDLPADVADALAQVALSGDWFDELELRAASDHGERTVHRLVEVALATGTIVPATGGYRFADATAASLLATRVAPHTRALVLERTAVRLADLGAAPERVADRLLAAGRALTAAPFALAAARRAAEVQLYRDVLRWTDVARGHLTGDDQAEALALRADALSAMGAREAVPAYRAALAAATPQRARGLRARLARAALFSGDIGSAEEALDGIEPDGGADDAAVLYARGLLAYFSGDIDAAEAAVDAARRLALTQGTPVLVLDAITLQGMIAHNRGEWFDRLRRELQATSESPALASTVFDSHLCVAEYLLYGPTPYADVVGLARQLRAQADQMGARPAAAFAAAVAGEASLLGGDLQTARAELAEAVELHTAIGADTGVAHALQRLAEVELADGNAPGAERLLRRALVLARWSPFVRHLLQRIYGTLVTAAPDREAALAVVDEAVEAADEHTSCLLCHVMIAVPAAIACAEGGRLDQARDWLAEAEASAAMWQGTAWQGAVHEAGAHLARADGDTVTALRLLEEAASLFETAGQPLDAQRCREAVDGAALPPTADAPP